MDDEVLAGPQLRQCCNARFCSTEGLRGLYDMRASVASQLKDAKGQTQTRLQMGNDLLERQIRLDFLGRLGLFAIRSAYRASNHASPPELRVGDCVRKSTYGICNRKPDSVPFQY